MADEDLDIETLTALLEDDSDDEEIQQETNKSDKNQDSNDESDIATLAAFLEDSDSDEDAQESGKPCTAKGDVESSKDTNGSQTNVQENVAVNPTSPVQSAENMNALQNQILMMQKQMEQMQKLLLQQQSPSSQGEVTPNAKSVPNLPKTKQSLTSSVPGKSSTIHTRDSPGNKVSRSSSTNILARKSPISQLKEKHGSKEIKSTRSPQHKAAKISSSSNTSKPKQTSKKESSEQEHNPFFGESEKSPTEEKKTPPVHVKVKSPSDTIKLSEALKRKEQEKSLFGDDSDSDWEGLDGEEKGRLSVEGNELRKLLHHGEKGRVSNASKQDVEELRKRAAKTSWKDRSHQQPEVTSKIGTPVTKSSKENDVPSVTDPSSGIRLINPKVSSTDMKYKMADRNLVKVSRIATQVGTSKLQGNWVTIAVVVSKTESRTSAAGKTYCIWKLSDLEDCDKTVSFFLFGEVYKQHWKNSVGTVAGILNPSIMDKAEKVQQDLAFTVNHPQQLLVMGQSKDLGRCTGVSKAGKPCTKFINKQHGDRCTYHVQSAYKKTSSHRSELQGSFTGMTPKAHAWNQNKKISSSFFFYQGETFTDLRPPANKNDKVTLNKLSEKQAVQGKGKVTTMSLHNLEPEDQKRLKDLKDNKSEFVDLLTTPSVGAMNFVKHLVKEEKYVKDTGGNNALIQSITPKELLQQHKLAAKERKRQLAQGRTLNPLEAVPTLGKGFSPGSDISLEVSFPRGKSVGIKMDLAKKKAIAKIHVSGGINKDDPNAVKKKIRSPESNTQVRKRVAENMDSTDKAKDGSCIQEPPRKRSKLLGNIDVNSEEFKQLMKVRSKHKGALAEVEAEHEERYFMAMEKKEKYEDKMSSIMEMKCKVFTCVQCNYTAFKPGDSCKENGHTIKTVETKKRFFKCKKCSHRATSIHKYPTAPCRNCGEQSFERTSMYQEKKMKTPSEELCIRGDEIKYLGSMQEKSFLNI
ncbi:protein MCM10 homolog [Mizuhopecten yessoensis]|uniref:Protein MCM10 homolog n=1 Tax=Mizuhopecten yessoensis TaxID=6573 RepID=A0A210PHX2_MIZYE|nr:protein MCM10 homolog [Mizuhopecten yessoensis]OWF36082.1 Protein MCM10-like [Mizuhopecten yessoensis]